MWYESGVPIIHSLRPGRDALWLLQHAQPRPHTHSLASNAGPAPPSLRHHNRFIQLPPRNQLTDTPSSSFDSHSSNATCRLSDAPQFRRHSVKRNIFHCLRVYLVGGDVAEVKDPRITAPGRDISDKQPLRQSFSTHINKRRIRRIPIGVISHQAQIQTSTHTDRLVRTSPPRSRCDSQPPSRRSLPSSQSMLLKHQHPRHTTSSP